MKDFGPPTPTVEAVAQINLEGNITPHLWFRHITFPPGKPPKPGKKPKPPKPDLLGVCILSEIAYWYRPVVIREESTGRVVEVRRKFAADKLQRSYDALAEQFGVSKIQVKRAVDRLKARGILTTEFRTIRGQGGVPLANVLFIEPDPKALLAITYYEPGDPYFDAHPSLLQSKDPLTSKSTGAYAGVTTYTETPAEITPETPQREKNAHAHNSDPPTREPVVVSALFLEGSARTCEQESEEVRYQRLREAGASETVIAKMKAEAARELRERQFHKPFMNAA
jgi:hypothetical protein